MVFSAFLRKPFNTSSQKGQAVTEYLLILIIVVLIGMGAIYQLSDAFNKYVQSYFGDYVACLLETGEMPGAGGGPRSEGCNASFEPFSFKNGRPAIAAGAQGAGARARNNGSRNSSNPTVTNTPSSSPTAERRRLGGAGNSVVGSIASPTKNARSASSGKGGGPSLRPSLLQSEARMNGKFRISGDDKEKKEVTPQRKLAAKDSKTRSPKKMSFDPTKSMPKLPEDSVDEGFSFGQYLRYFLIAAIVIGLVVLFGGQIMQVRRNQNAQ